MAVAGMARFLPIFLGYLKRRKSGMAHGMTRRQFAITASATSLAFGFGARAQGADAKTFRCHRNDLRVLARYGARGGVSRVGRAAPLRRRL